MAIRLPMRWFTFILSTLLTVAFIAAIGAGLVALLAWLSHGSLGLGRLTDIGPNPWHVFLWTGAEITAGGVIGYILGPWLEREGYRKNPWNSSLEESSAEDAETEGTESLDGESAGSARDAKRSAKLRPSKPRKRKLGRSGLPRNRRNVRPPDWQCPVPTISPPRSRSLRSLSSAPARTPHLARSIGHEPSRTGRTPRPGRAASSIGTKLLPGVRTGRPR